MSRVRSIMLVSLIGAAVAAAAVVPWGGARAVTERAEQPAPPVPPIAEAAFRPLEAEKAALGRFLFYDKLLSGNRNISCGTCHDHDFASGDGLSLGVGEGGAGVGTERVTYFGDDGIERRVPRNAPALFNLGAREFTVLFHDGRVSIDPTEPLGFDTPAEEFLPEGLDNVLAAQALFPMLAEVEMAGEIEENEIAGAARRRADYAWREIEKRLLAEPGYLPLFQAAYPREIERSADIRIVHVANAIAAFIGAEWRADDSPFDRYLRGETDALSASAARGMALFYGEAGCASCHAGPFQTDHAFHAIAMPQLGPGRTRRFGASITDHGRMNETDRLEDAYRFRTPSLRNVAHTGPYGHSGAYRSLEDVVRHHLDPIAAFDAYDPAMALLPDDDRFAPRDFVLLQDRRELDRIRRANGLAPQTRTEEEIADLIAFLHALTDERGLRGRLGKPDAVPSGLPIDRRAAD